MNVSYDYVRIAPKSEFLKELMDSSFEKITENDCGNVVVDNPKSEIAQPQTDKIQSILGGDDCENVEELQAIGSSNIPTAMSFLSTSAPALGTVERDIASASLSETEHTTKLRRDEQRELKILYDILGSKHLKKMNWIWLLHGY